MASNFRNKRIRVYVGPSLERRHIRKYLPGAQIHGPIKRLDLLRAARERVGIAVIVDGLFDQSLAVTAGEISDALCIGMAIFGSSSMGAMRAAEAHTLGMVGYGAIFEHIMEAEYFKDDRLGQLLFNCETGTWKAMAHTYMDVFFNLKLLRRQGRISESELGLILNQLDKIGYTDRSYEALRDALIRRGAAHHRCLHAAELAFKKMGSQKTRDAIGLLKLVGKYATEVSKRNKKIMKNSRAMGHECLK